MIIERVDDPELMARIGESASKGSRSSGLHVSAIYGRLMARLDPKKYGKPIDDKARRMMEMGILFENILEQALAEKYGTARVGEVFSPEGIAMSPDGINPTLVRGEEFKATYKKYPDKSTFVPEAGSLVDREGAPLMQFYVWFVQMRAYAKWLELLDWRLTACFILGDYTRPYTPIIQPYHISFSQEEVDDNWEMLLRVARDEGLL